MHQVTPEQHTYMSFEVLCAYSQKKVRISESECWTQSQRQEDKKYTMALPQVSQGITGSHNIYSNITYEIKMKFF